jgi:hypothetical protein|tara:strand:+ start:922 stop:1590 length:669 start_codon:yes stop_codon:yes gene_type:complete
MLTPLYIKNGLHIYALFGAMMLYTNNLFLTTIFSLKAFSANYWYHFYDLYDYNIPVKYNQIKQIVRFTDTGHIASFLYYFYPKFFPIAFNVHFAITFSYWITVKCFDMKDTDIDNDDRIIMSIQNATITLVHGVPLLLLVFEYILYKPCQDCFSQNDLYYSYAWLYGWFCLIYLPWRYITGDPVYSILSRDTPLKIVASAVTLMHVLFFTGNCIGYYMCKLL